VEHYDVIIVGTGAGGGTLAHRPGELVRRRRQELHGTPQLGGYRDLEGVVDTSFFPSSSAVNPSLTAIANALRVGDHLIDRLGARAAASSLV
jgi:choline dehydrogenase-like flavoprotein